MVAPHGAEAPTTNIIQQALEYLNTDKDTLYVLGFNTVIQAWTVLKCQRIEKDSGERYGLHVISPYANNHFLLADAIKDALIFKRGGH